MEKKVHNRHDKTVVSGTVEHGGAVWDAAILWRGACANSNILEEGALCSKSWPCFCVWLDVALIYLRKEFHAAGRCREMLACDLLIVPNSLWVLFLKSLCSLFFLPPSPALSSTKCCLPLRTFKLIFPKCWRSRTLFYCCHNTAQALLFDCVCKTPTLISSHAEERLEQQPLGARAHLLRVLLAKMTSLPWLHYQAARGDSRAGRRAQPCSTCLLWSRAVCQGNWQVLVLPLGNSFIAQHDSCRWGNVFFVCQHICCFGTQLEWGSKGRRGAGQAEVNRQLKPIFACQASAKKPFQLAALSSTTRKSWKFGDPTPDPVITSCVCIWSMSSCARRCSGWTSGRISSLKGGWALEWTVQGGGGVTTPGSVKEMTGCGTEYYGLVAWQGLVKGCTQWTRSLFPP